MSLNTQLIQRARRAPSLAQKQAALVLLVSQVLALHDAGFVVVDATREEVEADDRRLRLRLMATDGRSQSRVRFAEVLYRGDRGRASLDSPDAQHEFLVAVYWGAGAFSESSEAAFRAALESTAPDAPGLLWVLRAQEYVATAGGTVVGTIVENPVVRPVRIPALAGYDHQYEAAFSVTMHETGSN